MNQIGNIGFMGNRILDPHLLSGWDSGFAFTGFDNDLFMELYLFLHHIEGHTISVEDESVDVSPWGQNFTIPAKKIIRIENEGQWTQQMDFGKT